MPTSATGSSEAGFTLVELLVVITIAGIAMAAAVLAWPAPVPVADAADALALRLGAARDAAIVSGRMVTLDVASHGYAFAGTPPDARGLGRITLPAGVTLVAEVAGGPPISLDATGLATPARLLLADADHRAEITLDAVGAVHVRHF